MGANPLLGLIFHWIGGFCSATNFIPFRRIRRWSWEIYWIVQGVAAWLIAPLVIALIFVPHLFQILGSTPHRTIFFSVLFGVLWGIGGLTFGLAIRYLGIALGYAIALGLCTAFGTLIPPIYTGEIHQIAHKQSGQIVLLGVLVCIIAVFVNGLAGKSKEAEITPEEKVEAGESDYSLTRGVLIAVLAGVMSSFFNFGLKAGEPIGVIASRMLRSEGRADVYHNLPILIVVLWGGFLSNLIWTLILIVRNRSGRQFLGEPGSNPMRAGQATGDTLVDADPTSLTQHISSGVLTQNYFFAALAGIIWYFQFFFYSLGQTKMGKYDFSSWTLHMASIIIFATLWGIALKEWKGTSLRTKVLVTMGLLLLIGSTLIVGYGNYLQSM